MEIQPRLKSNIPMKNRGESMCSIYTKLNKLIKRHI